MPNGEMLRVLSGKTDIPEDVSRQFIVAAIQEVYRRLVVVEGLIHKRNGKERVKDLKWALKEIGIPISMLIIGFILASIFGGQ